MGFFDDAIKSTGAVTGAMVGGPLGMIAGSDLKKTGSEIEKALGMKPGDEFSHRVAPASQELTDAIMGGQEELGKGADERAAGLMENVDQAKTALGYDPTQAALSNRAARAFKQNSGDLGRQAQMMGHQDMVNRAKKGFDVSNEIIAAREGANYRSMQASADADAARNSVLASLGGGIGGAIGSYAGSRKSSGPATGGEA